LWDDWSNSPKAQRLGKYVASRDKGCDVCNFLLDVIGNVKPEWTEVTSDPNIDRVVAFRAARRFSTGPFVGNEVVLSEGGQEIATYQLFLPADGKSAFFVSQ